MKNTKTKLKENVDLILIDNEKKYKTNSLSIYFAIEDYSDEKATKLTMLSSVLERGCLEYKTNLDIQNRLMELYGAEFFTEILKFGDKGVLKLTINYIDNSYIPGDEDIQKASIDFLKEIIFNPYIVDGKFDEQYFVQEKNNLIDLINAQKDDKSQYSIDSCIKEMFKGTNYGTYKYGSIEELEKLTNEELYDFFKELLKNAKIDIVYSGSSESFENIKSCFENLEGRNTKIEFPMKTQSHIDEKISKIEEKQDVVQGKLVIGLDIQEYDEEKIPTIKVFNSLLGGSPNSKMFQNVREKANLCYVAKSIYSRFYNKVLILTGIEIKNYEKAFDLILEQLKQIQEGDFSEELLENLKSSLVEDLKYNFNSQESTASYLYLENLTGTLNNETYDLEKEIQDIMLVTKEDVIDIANKIKPQTSYFLTGEKGE